jgi:hypothetical protein
MMRTGAIPGSGRSRWPALFQSGINLGIACRTPCGRRSTSKPIYPRCEKRPHDSHGLCEQTKNAGHCEDAQDGDLDGRDSDRTFDRPGARQVESPVEDGDRATRTGLCHANSRVSLEVRIRNFWKGFWVSPQLGFNFITEGRQGRARSGIENDSFPLCIAVHFREDLWQTCDQLFPIIARKSFDCRCNLIDRAHARMLGSDNLPNKNHFECSARLLAPLWAGRKTNG